MAHSNPITLPPRFEVRKLEPSHHDWARAIICHSNGFCSPIWSVVYPDNQTDMAYRVFRTTDYLVSHSIDSGLSYGIFDTQYQFKHPSSAAQGGQLLWDMTDTTATRAQLLEQMDFPLVSVALAYDGINPLDPSKLGSLIRTLPLLGTMLSALEKGDKRDPESWKAKKAGEVLLRSGTCTREDYGGLGLAKGLAHWLMFEAKGLGYRGIQIETANRAVDKIWLSPPGGFKAELVYALETGKYEEEVDGKIVKVFQPCEVTCTRIYVTLA